ncbi:MAG: hypothetical protein ACLPZM_03950 [Thermoplasmata archaeon]
MPYVEYDEVEAVCAECGRIFRSEEALELHRRESHQTAVRPAPAPRRKRAPASPPASGL